MSCDCGGVWSYFEVKISSNFCQTEINTSEILEKNRERRRKVIEREEWMRMGRRKPLMIGVLVVMAMGIAVYLRLWTADYAVSSNDTELLRSQLYLCYFNMNMSTKISFVFLF